MSTNAEPTTGARRPHYEIFNGVTKDGGRTWTWTPITRDSAVDNIRRIMPKRERGRTALLWLRGAYVAYTNYDRDVVGIILSRE